MVAFESKARELDNAEINGLVALIDTCGLHRVLDALSSIADQRAGGLYAASDDSGLAKAWAKMSDKLVVLAHNENIVTIDADLQK